MSGVDSFWLLKLTCCFDHPKNLSNKTFFRTYWPLRANLIDFGSQLPPPEPPQNLPEYPSKTHLILRCPETQNLVRVLRMDHIFPLPGGPKIGQKSTKNRSQEPSMLSSNFVSKKNASWTLPGGFLSASCNKNKHFGAHFGLQQGTKKTTHFDTWPSFWSNTTGNPKLSLITPNLSPKSEPKSRFLDVGSFDFWCIFWLTFESIF